MSAEWRETFFVLLPKTGNLDDPSNWRPIAVLWTCYKISARVIYNRLRGQLDAQQSEEQMGFRSRRSTTDALLVLETVTAKSFEFKMPLWLASLYLKKAFDRIEWPQLFRALHEQSVSHEYCHLLATLYDEQSGSLGQLGSFDIRRGVKQGDVLSPMSFNAGLELAMRMWKARLHDHGLLVSGSRLTNVRYADDLIIYSNSVAELEEMLEILVEELGKIGLAVNAKKCKIFTNNEDVAHSGMQLFIDSGDGFMEVTRTGEFHKYLGRMLPGHLANRGKVNLDYRVRCAWSKFKTFRHALTDKHIDVKLRLRLFDIVVTPSALYGLSSTPLTATNFEHLAVTQRKMLRLIVGYVKGPDDSRADMYRRLRDKIGAALQRHTIRDWVETLKADKQLLSAQVQSGERCLLTCQVTQWHPPAEDDPNLAHTPRRKRGRPRTGWSQH